MSDQLARHCPFLNRSDERCAQHFSLDHLNDAFDHCVSGYAGCPVYLELLAEVRVRRAAAGREMRRLHPGQSAGAGHWASADVPPIVPLTVTAGGRSGGQASV